MALSPIAVVIAAGLLGTALASCGQKGPLTPPQAQYLNGLVPSAGPLRTQAPQAGLIPAAPPLASRERPDAAHPL